MKTIIALFVANIVSIACVLIAGYLALNCIGGWGYFLFVALLTAHTIRQKICDTEN